MDNNTLFLYIFNLHNQIPLLDSWMIFGATYLIYIAALGILAVGVFGKHRDQQATGLTVLGLLIGWGLIQLIHVFILEPRPFITNHLLPLVTPPTSWAFPSEHTTIIAVAAFAFAFYRSSWTPWLLGVMIWIGFARIYVGVHYPLDILGGILVGLLAVVIAWKVKKYLRNFLQN